jgi:hypothetical protein
MRDQAAIYRKESFSILGIEEQKILRDTVAGTVLDFNKIPF